MPTIGLQVDLFGDSGHIQTQQIVDRLFFLPPIPTSPIIQTHFVDFSNVNRTGRSRKGDTAVKVLGHTLPRFRASWGVLCGQFCLNH